MPLHADQEAALIEAVRRVARAEILPRFRALSAGEIDTKSGPEDLVTVADRAAERALEAAVSEILPEAAFVGEEGVSADPKRLELIGSQDLCVIVDPIDGTWNFAHGLAVFGVILAVVARGQTVFGLIYDPSFDDWIAARRGGGAWRGGPQQDPVPLALSDGPVRREEAAGFSSLFLYPLPYRRRLAEEFVTWRRVHSLRCSAHEYRLLAQGSADFCLNAMLSPWDHAAGALIMEEAGGVCRLLDGRDYRPTLTEGRLLTARSEALWQALATRLRALGPIFEPAANEDELDGEGPLV